MNTYSSSQTDIPAGSRQFPRDFEGHDVVTSGEDCVRHHPETAVWTSFATGLLIGAAVGFAFAEYREDSWRREMRKMVKGLQRRLPWA